jgi:hypothetical protein
MVPFTSSGIGTRFSGVFFRPSGDSAGSCDILLIEMPRRKKLKGKKEE